MNAVAIGIWSAGFGLFVTLSWTAPARAQEAADLDEIVVTGSHIHGADAAGSKVIVIDREQIDASGYARLAVRIGQPGGEESLNVAAAAAICLHASSLAQAPGRAIASHRTLVPRL